MLTARVLGKAPADICAKSRLANKIAYWLAIAVALILWAPWWVIIGLGAWLIVAIIALRLSNKIDSP